MARTIDRIESGIAVAEPPVILEEPETPIPTPFPRKTSRRRFLGKLAFTAGGLGAVAVLYQTGVIQTGLNWADEFLRKRGENIQRREALSNRPLGPLPGQEASWWMELPEERIRELAQLPEINQIGERYVSTVSPALQEKAQQAGYKLIYQGDPEDTVGRTVITKGRRPDQQIWSIEDLGFGRAGLEVRGILQAWVPDPEDPNQKETVYALLQNPITNKEYLVAVQLFPYDPNRFDVRPTWFVVGNLMYGPDYVRAKTAPTIVTNKQTGATSEFYINPDLMPDPPSIKPKELTDFSSFNELLREKGLQLTDIIKPGDYVKATMQTADVDMETSRNTYKKDGHGVNRSLMITVRRFGGLQQWQSEFKDNTLELDSQ